MPYRGPTLTDPGDIELCCKLLSSRGTTMPEQAGAVTSIDLTYSAFSDPGPDWCLYALMFHDGRRVSVKLDGY